MTIAAPKFFSFEEYLQYDDGTQTRYELVDGQLVPMNPPTFRHLLIAKYLEQCLDAEIKRLGLPWICLREAGVRTGWRKSRLTDLYVVAADQVAGLLDESTVCQTAPLMIVEVVSPESIKRDYRHKRSEYAALAVPEYWIIDPMKSQISVLLWDEGLYEEKVFMSDHIMSSKAFPELTLTPVQILTAGTGEFTQI
jgi:Uma2 family endonuclease